MIYEIIATDQADADLRDIYEYIALNCFHRIMPQSSLNGWRNTL